MRKNGRKSSDKSMPETIDASTGKPDGTPDKPKRRIDLSSLRDVRLELAVVYRQMDSGEIESQEGTRKAYVLKTIGDVIEMADLERRIAELEEQQAGGVGSRQALSYHRNLNEGVPA